MNKKIILVILIVAIVGIGFLIYKKLDNNNLNIRISEFNEEIMNAAEFYLDDHIDEYDDFDNPGDEIFITAQTLIDNDYLDYQIDNPTEKKLEDVVVKVTLLEGNSTRFVVLD